MPQIPSPTCPTVQAMPMGGDPPCLSRPCNNVGVQVLRRFPWPRFPYTPKPGHLTQNQHNQERSLGWVSLVSRNELRAPSQTSPTLILKLVPLQAHEMVQTHPRCTRHPPGSRHPSGTTPARQRPRLGRQSRPQGWGWRGLVCPRDPASHRHRYLFAHYNTTTTTTLTHTAWVPPTKQHPPSHHSHFLVTHPM
jgi:hypothetical protein